MKLSEDSWTFRAKNHAFFISPIIDAFLERRSVGKTHPVHDFLFTYYNCSPQKLRQWVPSFEEELVVSTVVRCKGRIDLYPWLNDYWFSLNHNILSLKQDRISSKTVKLASFVANLCDNILKRPSRFSCFGLHEWAMVYKLSPNELRHKNYKLRLPMNELNHFVESQTICCSHYDAYRFFTKEAHPLNILHPLLETRLNMEQAGCVHANMDLYKWAIKLWPWIGSDLLAKTFFLALEGRELDMRASPYDLINEGYAPICIETETGRKLYQLEQKKYTERANALREELHAFCQRLIATKLPIFVQEGSVSNTTTTND